MHLVIVCLEYSTIQSLSFERFLGNFRFVGLCASLRSSSIADKRALAAHLHPLADL